MYFFFFLRSIFSKKKNAINQMTERINMQWLSGAL